MLVELGRAYMEALRSGDEKRIYELEREAIGYGVTSDVFREARMKLEKERSMVTLEPKGVPMKRREPSSMSETAFAEMVEHVYSSSPLMKILKQSKPRKMSAPKVVLPDCEKCGNTRTILVHEVGGIFEEDCNGCIVKPMEDGEESVPF